MHLPLKIFKINLLTSQSETFMDKSCKIIYACEFLEVKPSRALRILQDLFIKV